MSACSAAYERSQPVFNYQLNGCGTTYINIGDGGAIADKHARHALCCAPLMLSLTRMLLRDGRIDAAHISKPGAHLLSCVDID